MSKFSSVACSFTKKGFEQFIKEYERKFAEYPDKGDFWQYGVKNKNRWLNNPEICYHNEDGEVLFRLPFVRWYEEFPETKLFVEALDTLEPEDHYYCQVDEEGTESYTLGKYIDNSFNLKLAARISSENTGVEIDWGYALLINPDIFKNVKKAYNKILDGCKDDDRKELFAFYNTVFITHSSVREYNIPTSVISTLEHILSEFDEDDYLFLAANSEKILSIGEYYDEEFGSIELQTDISFEEPLPIEEDNSPGL